MTTLSGLKGDVGERQAKHEAFVAGYLERNVTDATERAGVRCGLSDAAHLCDAIAADILAAGRSSRKRDELAAIAKRCGDAIWKMREQVR